MGEIEPRWMATCRASTQRGSGDRQRWWSKEDVFDRGQSLLRKPIKTQGRSSLNKDAMVERSAWKRRWMIYQRTQVLLQLVVVVPWKYLVLGLPGL